MRTRSFVLFASGAAFALALLTRCGIAPADGAGGDLGSCQCPPAPDPVVRSGTRLKAIVLRSDDGAQQFVGWWDSKLGTACAVGSDTTSPTAGRCVPMPALGEHTSHFADSACTVPAVARAPATAAATYCAADGVYSPLGEQITTIYTTDSTGACVVADDAFAHMAGATFYACDQTPVPTDTFVPLTATHD